MSKELRADLHARFADRLDSMSSLQLADELVGYHLERAVLLRRELGASGAATADLAARACSRLRAAGRRAVLRDDSASVSLFERVLALTAPADRAPALVELADALGNLGHLERSAATAAAALDLAEASNDPKTTARARAIGLKLTFDRWEGDSDLVSLEAAVIPVLEELERLEDDKGMAGVLLLLGQINMDHFERSSGYYERALAAAERSGDRRVAAFAAGSLGLITVFGPLSAGEGIERCRALRSRVADHRIATGTLVRHEAVLCAMQGRAAEARRLYDDYKRVIDDLGNLRASANTVFGAWELEMLAGEPRRAEAAARTSLELFQEFGATNPGSTAAAMLAVALVRQGRYEEASGYADLAASWAAPDDIASQVGQLTARAHVLAARGDLSGAQAAARDAVRQSERSDNISQRGDALVDLAAVLERAGRTDEASNALRDAIALYERKGNVVGRERAHTQLGRLGAGAAVSDATT